MKRSILFAICLGIITSNLYADTRLEESHNNKQTSLSHAPISVMRDHTHHQGEWMLSYRLMSMDMGQLHQGNTAIDRTTVTNQFMMSPTSMQMIMHMVGVMYAPSDTWTLMAMMPYHSRSMTMINRMGVSSEMTASGPGDLSLSALYSLEASGADRFLAHVGLSLPSGAIDKSQTRMGNTQRLPYSMQLSSGTTDFLAGGTYSKTLQDLQLGTQAAIQYRGNTNSAGYRLGHKASLTGWISKAWSHAISNSLRLSYTKQGAISGEDALISAQTMSPSTHAANTGYSSLDLGIGLNFLGHEGALKDHRFAIEYVIPLSTSTNGIQLATSSTLTFGWQKALL